jgi:hypothetical protein
MEFVVNEWLLEYIRRDAEPQNRADACKFLEHLKNKPDKLVIKRKSRFSDKYYWYMKEGEHDDRSKEISKFLGYLLRDSNKTTIMEEEEVPQIPEDIKEDCPADDIYLIELALFSKDRTIITTDRKLKEKMNSCSILKILIFSDFIQTYDC